MIGDEKKPIKLEEADEGENNEGYSFPKTAIIIISGIVILMIVCIIIILVNRG